VLVGVNRGVDLGDFFAQTLLAEIRAGVDDKAGFRRFHVNRRAQALITRILRRADFAVAANYRYADGRACAEKSDREIAHGRANIGAASGLAQVASAQSNNLWPGRGCSPELRAMDATPEISIEQQVIFCDTDCGGVVSNIAYLRFIEAARVRLGEVLGWGLKFQAARGEFITVVRTEIDYKRPAVLGDDLTIHAKLEDVERACFWNGFRIERDGQLLTECRQRLAIVGMPKGRVVRVPEDWKSAT
jgi:YbgC/YbaW family acyl-CoA thioester hydrolase